MRLPRQHFRGRIEFRNVVFSYPSIDPTKKKGDAKARPTLNGLSFTIQPGQVVAVVGHTGAGKSTIAQLIPRLYDPNEGEIFIDGHDIRDYTLESLRAQMSMVLQESILFTGSIVENIAYGRPDATGHEIIEAAKNANADEFISKFSGWLLYHFRGARARICPVGSASGLRLRVPLSGTRRS